MRVSGRRGWVCVATVVLLCGLDEASALTKTQDRKFPIGTYCPLESRAAAGADLSFVAPAATIRVTFSGDNQDSLGQWNAFHIDNVTVVAKSTFDANLVVSPGFELCYDPTIPPGQTTGGDPNAPAYDFNATGTTEAFLDLFNTSISGWTGSHIYFDSTSRAPTLPASGTGINGGSLGMGLSTDGAVQVSASHLVTGLTPGQTYELFAWWYVAQTSPLTMTISVPCPDQDGDGFVVCGACDPQPGEICGDCNDNNAHCNTNCTDADGDGWCVTTDCNDTVATCTGDCVTDADADGVPDCRDGCIDADRDGYGTPGGAANTCLGPDCNPTNPWCNVSCVDADGDGHCAPGDCNDNDPKVANGLPEINDWRDQNCPGDDGFGVADEISGVSGFSTPSSYSWPAQTGALSYQAVRSSSSTFPPGCATITTSSTSWSDGTNPPAGGIFYYLVRPLTSAKGSWGQRSTGAERAVICGAESNCTNGIDDDGDTLVDCADTDCANTAACRVQTFAFTDTVNDDIADDALFQFFQSGTAGASDYIFFEIVENATRRLAWCSQNAGFYRTQYLQLATNAGSVLSGTWSKWRKAPSTGNNWTGADTTPHNNDFGDNCFGIYTWCSEQFPPEPQNCIFPDRTNDCEAYDLTTGACGVSVGETWQLTIKVASTRMLACGF